MWIMSNNGKKLINSDELEEMSIQANETGNRHTILGINKNQTKSSVFIARYYTEHQAELALGYLFSAMSDGKNAYYMPDAESLDFGTQGNTHVKTKANRHGGS